MHYPLAALKLKWIKFERRYCLWRARNYYKKSFIFFYIGVFVFAMPLALVIINIIFKLQYETIN